MATRVGGKVPEDYLSELTNSGCADEHLSYSLRLENRYSSRSIGIGQFLAFAE